MSKLLKSFGVLWGTSQVESNSIDTSGYAFENTCRNPLTIFVVVLAAEFAPCCWRVLETEEYFHPEKIRYHNCKELGLE